MARNDQPSQTDGKEIAMTRYLLSLIGTLLLLASWAVPSTQAQVVNPNGVGGWQQNHDWYSTWRPQMRYWDQSAMRYQWRAGPDGYYFGYTYPQNYVAYPFWYSYPHPVYPSYGTNYGYYSYPR
jgi:hypothetical protein